MNGEQVVKTKSPRGDHWDKNGKHEPAACMVRLVRELAGLLEESGVFHSDSDHVAVDNVLYAFLKTLPKKVQEDLLHG